MHLNEAQIITIGIYVKFFNFECGALFYHLITLIEFPYTLPQNIALIKIARIISLSSLYIRHAKLE